MEEFTLVEQGFRYVRCFCGKTEVVTRRDPSKDQFAICSKDCFDDMVRAGKNESGTLMREVLRGW